MTGQAELSVSYINASVFSGRDSSVEIDERTPTHPKPGIDESGTPSELLPMQRAVFLLCAAAPLCVGASHFPVISRFVGGRWTNAYKVFNGIDFERQEDR